MITEEQKRKLRELLAKIATPEELKELDLDILKKQSGKNTESIIKEIEKSKVDTGIFKALIDMAAKVIS